MTTLSGYVLIALGLGHTIVGFVKYRPVLVALFRDGYFNAAAGHTDRLLAFWFLMFSAMLLLLGQVTLYAARTNDIYLMRLLFWYVACIGALGATALPRSPFWIAIILATLMLREAYVVSS